MSQRSPMSSDPPEAPLSVASFAVALTGSVAVVLSAPFTGEARRWLRLTFPDQFVAIVGVSVACAAIVVVALAFMRIRDRRAARYGLVGAAAVLAVAYSAQIALGSPESDVVEHVHFFEYGLVAWLFYRAWLPVGDASVLCLALFAAFTVGTCEEGFQWFIPGRVGEVRDIFLNGAAIVCGLLFSLAVTPPLHLGLPRRPRSWQHLLAIAAIALAAFTAFLDRVHVGYEIVDAEAGTFRSIYTARDLDTLARDRVVRWAASPPTIRPPGLSREDQYMSEGLLHVRERNRLWEAGAVHAAWFENRILERYFAPVLDTPSYVSATGHRWPAVQRLDAERRHGEQAGRQVTFVSRAQGEFPIFVWSKPLFRASSALLVMTLGLASVVVRRGRFARILTYSDSRRSLE